MIALSVRVGCDMLSGILLFLLQIFSFLSCLQAKRYHFLGSNWVNILFLTNSSLPNDL